MSPIAIRPAIVGNGGPQNFRPLRLPTWAPPGRQFLFNEKRMGQKKSLGAFSVDALPTSLAIGAASVGAIIIGAGITTKADQPTSIWKTILIGGGLAGLGISIFNLFSGKEIPESEKGGTKSERTLQKTAAVAEFENVTGRFIAPKMYEDTSYWVNANANLAITNDADKAVDMRLIVEQYELDYSLFGRSTAWEAQGQIINEAFTVRAKGTEYRQFEVDSDSLWKTAIKLVAYKLRSATDNPVKLAEVIFYG